MSDALRRPAALLRPCVVGARAPRLRPASPSSAQPRDSVGTSPIGSPAAETSKVVAAVLAGSQATGAPGSDRLRRSSQPLFHKSRHPPEEVLLGPCQSVSLGLPSRTGPWGLRAFRKRGSVLLDRLDLGAIVVPNATICRRDARGPSRFGRMVSRQGGDGPRSARGLRDGLLCSSERDDPGALGYRRSLPLPSRRGARRPGVD
jgi:hypothetical protein